MKKICVLGGSGFLGSHVCDELSEAGFEVIIFDRTPSKWLRDGQRMIIGDILDATLISDISVNCYALYNFAAVSDLDYALDKPYETAEINIMGNINALEACKKNNIEKYIYASTVYVNSRAGGFYRCSKRSAEAYVEEYGNQFGVEYTILRYGSLYGPRSNSTNGLWRIVKKALEDKRVTYEGSPDAMREYIHVSDAAKASVKALSSEFRNQKVVLTGQEPMRVIDLLKMLSEILNINEDVNFIEKDKLGHYIRTPYAFESTISRKYIPPMHVDLGQGLLELVENIQRYREEGGA